MTTRQKPQALWDLECYRDYFLMGCKRVDTGKTVMIEMYDGMPFDKDRARAIMENYETVGFNTRNYDAPMIALALRGFSCAQLKEVSDWIITGVNDEGGGVKPWDVERRYDFRIPRAWQQIDLIEVAPGQASLKIYGGRLFSHKMQDLPIEPDASISPEDRERLKLYCGNDLGTTHDLLNKLKPQLDLRRMLSQRYGVDLMSKSDAQIAEAVIKRQIEDITGERPAKGTLKVGRKFHYVPPSYMRFETPEMQAVLDMVAETEFVVKRDGKVDMPESLETAEIAIGKGVYRMGIGGLHSSESSIAHFSDENDTLIDRDVRSYYPSIILNEELYPAHLGRVFLQVYRSIFEERLAAKDAGNDIVADALKITINGTFGKLGSRWSIFYSPDLLIQVTLTGQLCLLMLIEALEEDGIPVVSANTDGIVIKCPTDREDDLLAIVRWWEETTGFETEETRYKAVYSRDVNNYLAVYDAPKKGKHYKAKGAYAPAGLQKNPTTEICVDAVADYLIHGTPVECTIRSCTDIRKFIAIKKVDGGAVQGATFREEVVGTKMRKVKGEYQEVDATERVWNGDGNYLGKAVRFYYSTQSPGPIQYTRNGNMVGRSEGSRALMELVDELPDDLDYDWYIREAKDLIGQVGAGEVVYRHDPDTEYLLT
ncbi:DNA polymerase I [compost metagenome]